MVFCGKTLVKHAKRSFGIPKIRSFRSPPFKGQFFPSLAFHKVAFRFVAKPRNSYDEGMLTELFRLAICFSACLAFCIGGSAVAQSTSDIDFEKQIRPLLIEKCGECHGPDEQSSDLRLDARHAAFKGGSGGPVIIAGKADGSELIRRITTDGDEQMPPDGQLSNRDTQLLTNWIAEGANWPETDYDREAARDPRRDHWAFQPVRRPDVPSGNDVKLNNPVDRFVSRRLNENGLQFSPPADRSILIRRLSLDLLGLLPSPEQVEKFVNDDDPDAVAKLVNQMLASPRYGERWAQHWLDLVRYADTHGFEVNTPRENAWPYRDYVTRRLSNG